MTEESQTSQIGAGLMQIAQILRADQWATGEQHGLTPTQIGVLRALVARGPLRVTELSKLLVVSQPTMSDVVSALEAKELVLRRPDPDDGRAKVIAATRKAEDLAPALTRSDTLADAIGHLGDADRAALKRALVLVIRHLQTAGAVSPQRHCLTCRFFRPYAHSDAAEPHHCAFVDAAFGDASLRLDCGDHENAPAEQAHDAFVRFEMQGSD